MITGRRPLFVAVLVGCLITAPSSPVAASEIGHTADGACAFSPAALTANRSGRLADEQARIWRLIALDSRTRFHHLAFWDGVIGAVLLSARGPSSKTAARIALGIAALATAPLIYLWPNRSALTADVQAGRVESVAGAITKHRLSGRTTSFYYFDIAGRRFEISRAGYDAAPDAGLLRVYFLPRSHRVVNWERLPDVAIPTGPDALREILDDFAAARRSHDPNAIAVARAREVAWIDAISGRPACTAR